MGLLLVIIHILVGFSRTKTFQLVGYPHGNPHVLVMIPLPKNRASDENWNRAAALAVKACGRRKRRNYSLLDGLLSSGKIYLIWVNMGKPTIIHGFNRDDHGICWWDTDGILGNISSGKLTLCYGKSSFYGRVNQLFLWSFSSSLCLPEAIEKKKQWTNRIKQDVKICKDTSSKCTFWECPWYTKLERYPKKMIWPLVGLQVTLIMPSSQVAQRWPMALSGFRRG